MKLVQLFLLPLLLLTTQSASAQAPIPFLSYQNLFVYLPGSWLANDGALDISIHGGRLYGSMTVTEYDWRGYAFPVRDPHPQAIEYYGQNVVSLRGDQYFVQFMPSRSAYSGDTLQLIRLSDNLNPPNPRVLEKEMLAYVDRSLIGQCGLGYLWDAYYGNCVRISSYACPTGPQRFSRYQPLPQINFRLPHRRMDDPYYADPRRNRDYVEPRGDSRYNDRRGRPVIVPPPPPRRSSEGPSALPGRGGIINRGNERDGSAPARGAPLPPTRSGPRGPR